MFLQRPNTQSIDKLDVTKVSKTVQENINRSKGPGSEEKFFSRSGTSGKMSKLVDLTSKFKKVND